MPNVGFFMFWNITAGGKSYMLTFDSDDLHKLAEKLDGKTVVVTGKPINCAVVVASMKADETEPANGKATAEIKGQIKRLRVARGPFADLSECWGIAINGQTYELDFGGLGELAEMAKDLDRKEVVVSGILEVTPRRKSVIEIQNARGSWPIWIPGRMVIHVTSLAVVKAQ
jgi:hypothetical protein